MTAYAFEPESMSWGIGAESKSMFDFDYESAPSWPVYRDLQTFAAILQRDLDRKPGFRARDMIDIQSFIWVQGSAEYER